MPESEELEEGCNLRRIEDVIGQALTIAMNTTHCLLPHIRTDSIGGCEMRCVLCYIYIANSFGRISSNYTEG